MQTRLMNVLGQQRSNSCLYKIVCHQGFVVESKATNNEGTMADLAEGVASSSAARPEADNV